MPIEEPSLAGLTINGTPSLRATARRSESLVSTAYGGVGSPSACHSSLARSLSMASAEASTPLPVFRDAEPLEHALHRAILAETPVQGDESTLEALADQRIEAALGGIERQRVDAAEIGR